MHILCFTISDSVVGRIGYLSDIWDGILLGSGDVAMATHGAIPEFAVVIEETRASRLAAKKMDNLEGRYLTASVLMTTKTKPNKHSEPDTYMELIDRMALKPIKDEIQHDQAVQIIGELIGRKSDGGTSDYLDTLILLVNKYEDEHHTPDGLDLSPQEALRAIMSANGISQAKMGKIIGSESAVSMFLDRERGLSKAHIKAIVARFRVNANLFL